MKKNVKEAILSKKRGKAEIIALLLYIVGVSVISFFHEPWFDESQSWLIAKSAPIKDILFHIPHYEGHPPLWHLILAPFAKLGAPFELTISAINIAFCSAAIALLLFKSPFPKIVRCLIPFSFFLFYQYGVLSRPYSVMMLAFILAAMTYNKRGEKPLPYVLSLALICLSHLFGLAIAGGLALVWVFEIFAKYKKAGNLKGVFKEKSCYNLLGLAVLAAFLIYNMIPADDIYNKGLDYTLIENLKRVHLFFIIPSNATVSSYFDYISFDTVGLILDMCLGAAILAIIIYICAKNKKLMLFLIPYLFYFIISVVYFSLHHLGIFDLLMIFIFWVICEDPQGDYTKLREKAARINSKVQTKALRGIAVFAFVAISLIPIYQSIASAFLEIKYPYGYGRALAEFLVDTGLSQRKILVDWNVEYDLDGLDDEVLNGESAIDIAAFDLTEFNGTDRRIDNTCMTNHSIVLAYIGENIFMNHNIDNKSMLYFDYREPGREEVAEVLEKWHDEGLPEVILGKSGVDVVFSEEELENYRYVRVAAIDFSFIYKYSHIVNNPIGVYVRDDILEEYPELHELKF